MNKLIKLSDTHYIVVNNSEIKKGDKFIIEATLNTNFFSILTANNADENVKSGRLKITHSTEPLEETGINNEDINITKKLGFYKIKQLSLSEVEEVIYGYIVKKLGKIALSETDLKSIDNSYESFHHQCELYLKGYIKGFKVHEELIKDKLHEILSDFYVFATNGEVCKHEVVDEFLLPKTEWYIEIVDGKIKLI